MKRILLSIAVLFGCSQAYAIAVHHLVAKLPNKCFQMNDHHHHCFFNNSLQAKRLEKLDYLLKKPLSVEERNAYQYEKNYIISTGKLLTTPELDEKIDQDVGYEQHGFDDRFSEAPPGIAKDLIGDVQTEEDLSEESFH